MIDKKREIKSAVGFSIGPIISSAIGFLTTPIVTFFIMPEEYARLNMYLLFQNILSVSVYLALDQAFVRFFNERKDKRALWRQAVLIPFIISSVIALIILLNYRFFSEYLFEINGNYLPIVLFCISIPLIVIERFVLLWIRMQEYAFKYSFFNIMLKSSVLTITVLSMMLYEKSYISAIYGYVLGQIIVDIVLVMSNAELLKGKCKTHNKADIVELLQYSLPLAPAAFISLLLNSTDRIMLNEIGTLTDVGLYSVALRISGMLSIIKSCITSFWTPMSLRWKSEGIDNKQFNRIMDIFIFLLSGVFFCCLLIKPVIFLLFGKEYQQATNIYPYLLFYPILYTMSEIFIVGIIYKKKGHIITVCNALSFVLNVGLNWILIPILGGVGAAFTTALCNGVYFFLIMYYSRKHWYKFPCTKMVLIVALMYIIATINTFVNSELIMFIVNIFALAITLGTYKYVIRDVVGVFRNR